ncbi:MAG: GNAT family N-acetyltransferase [Marinibacterium sp.]
MSGPPERLDAQDPRLPGVLTLIQGSFADMDGRIDPPSSMHHLTLADIRHQCRAGEVWVIGDPVVACVFLSPRKRCLYLGKLAVAGPLRKSGLARQLIDTAAARAAALGLPVLEAQSRVELSEVHRAFARMGFAETGRTAHPGFDRPTSITLQRRIDLG